jgi:very-short-patch-repair endonuclease
LLEAQGWAVLRVPYEPPLNDANLREILATIKRFLDLDDEEK